MAQIDDSLSTIEADPNSIPADGSSTSDVTVTLVNEDGDQLTSGGDNVTLFTNGGLPRRGDLGQWGRDLLGGADLVHQPGDGRYQRRSQRLGDG
ncbi:MAG: Ig-like domain-containing protein [Balneolaceae bacterium]|nr:Ig-like domain-containing protein [Balneolaceae bacterium]